MEGSSMAAKSSDTVSKDSTDPDYTEGTETEDSESDLEYSVKEGSGQQANMSDKLLGVKDAGAQKKRKKKKISKKMRKKFGGEKAYDERALLRAKQEMNTIMSEQELPKDVDADSMKDMYLINGVVRVSTLFKGVLKPHQVDGVSFVWQHLLRNQGCILADYMGLGKTLQVICVLHCFLRIQPKACVLVLAPASVVDNWKREIFKWFPTTSKAGREARKLFNTKVLDTKVNTMQARVDALTDWKNTGGVLVMGYDLFRILATVPQQTLGRDIYELARNLILDTPSVIVTDEGHRLRKAKSLLVQAIVNMKTKRRIVLTGYPLQNHLKEYYTMVNFSRPEYLGTLQEFNVRFIVPIENGQASDSVASDVVHARQRTYVLNQLLQPLVLRRGAELLARELPPKYEWLLRCRQTPLQGQLYRGFVRERIREADETGGSKNGGIIAAYHHSLAIVNHPDILYTNLQNVELKDTTIKKHLEFYHTCHLQNGKFGIQFAGIDPLASEASRGVTEMIVIRRIAANQPQHMILKPYDVLIEVEGVSCTSTAQLRTMIQQVAQATPVVSLKFRRYQIGSTEQQHVKTFLEIATAGGVEPSRESEAVDSKDSVIDSKDNVVVNKESDKAETDDVEVLDEMYTPSGAEHKFKWAVPLMDGYVAKADPELSGKMKVLMSILRASRLMDDKVLVFSQSVKTLNLIQSILIKHNVQVDHSRLHNTTEKEEDKKTAYLPNTKCGFLRLDGSIPQSKRLELVENFNDTLTTEIAVFLLSTRAAGEGLNIHSANRVVMFDACWNPCLDHEAMCRAYRFGQTKVTYVYRLVAAGTMERTIYDQQTRKEALTQRVVDAKATKRTVTTQDLRDFFNLKRFNKVQKQTLKVDLDETGGDAEKMKEREALSKDKVLLEALQHPDELVTEFRLENLLMNEDESEKLQTDEKKAAMELYKKQLAMENELVAQGHSAASAASIATAKFTNNGQPNGHHTPHPQHQYQQQHQQRYQAPGPAPAYKPPLMNVRFLVLQRRMPSAMFESVCQLIRQYGGIRVLELDNKTQYVISEWSRDQLIGYITRIRDRWIKDYNLPPNFQMRAVCRNVAWLYHVLKIPLPESCKVPPAAPKAAPSAEKVVDVEENVAVDGGEKTQVVDAETVL